MAPPSNVTMSLKLLIDTEKKKVLFAEAGKDFVDFLFHFLTLPVGTVTRLLAGKGLDGSLENLYDSVKCLNDCYIQPNQDKAILLNPKVPATSVAAGNICFPLADKVLPPKIYARGSHHQYFSDDTQATCPECGWRLKGVKHASSGHGESGFVKGVVTYMIMDDLVVTPMSTISGITLLNKFNVTNVGDLKEQIVTIGMDEAVKLLKASLETKTVLTNVFLSNMEK